MFKKTPPKKAPKPIISRHDISCLQVQLGVAKEKIIEAVAKVGNDHQKIVNYLIQKNWID